VDSRGETPPELAGEDARATICPRSEKDGVKMHPNLKINGKAPCHRPFFGYDVRLILSIFTV